MDATRPAIEVVGAVIARDGLVLCARRGPGRRMAGRWEFPGGKVEVGETPEAALAREIAEELGCRIRVGEIVARAVHDDGLGAVVLTTYRCDLVDGEPSTTEHEELRWLPPAALAALEWAPADFPTVEVLTGGGLTR